MNYEALQTRRFARQYKKLHHNIVIDVDAAIDAVSAKPSIGERKKGEFASRLQKRDHFISKVLAGPKIFLIGDEARLKELHAGA